MRKLAEKSSFMGKKSSFKGKNRVLSFLVKSSFPQNAQKKPALQAVLFLYSSLIHICLTNALKTYVPQTRSTFGVFKYRTIKSVLSFSIPAMNKHKSILRQRNRLMFVISSNSYPKPHSGIDSFLVPTFNLYIQYFCNITWKFRKFC